MAENPQTSAGRPTADISDGRGSILRRPTGAGVSCWMEDDLGTAAAS